MPVISVIVPVYKKEKYLSKCIESILGQTLADLELILIDDGSPDRCGAICDKYAEKDERVIVIHQKNRGVSAARNAGLDIATGDYLAFVDADDWISPDMYENMLKTAKSSNAEIVACAIRVWSEGGDHLRDLLPENRSYNRDQMLEELFQTPDQLGGTCCNKLFVKSAVRGMRFLEDIKMCEDRIYLFDCYSNCRKCVKVSEPYSQVTESANSATRTQSVYPLFEIISSGRMMIDMARKYSEALGNKATRRYLDDGIRYMRQVKSIREETKEKCSLRMIRVYCELLVTLASCYIKRKLPKSVINGYTFDLFQVCRHR